MRRVLSSLLPLVLVIACFAGCGGEDTISFAGCGDGVLDATEECDDGPGLAHSNDRDGCLSTCKLAVCGDGFVDESAEECDLNNLGLCAGREDVSCSCTLLGFEEGTGLRCNRDCSYDRSGCGAPLPTVVPTATPTATPPPSPTATPLAGQCGNSAIEADETCDDGNTSDNDACPSDCRIRVCVPTSTRLQATTVFSVPSGSTARSATVLLSYPDGSVDLPNGSERARITARGGVALTLEQDFQHALRVRINRVQGIPSADVFSVSFDTCQGAALPSADDFTCSVLACDGVSGCNCTVQLR